MRKNILQSFVLIAVTLNYYLSLNCRKTGENRFLYHDRHITHANTSKILDFRHEERDFWVKSPVYI